MNTNAKIAQCQVHFFLQESDPDLSGNLFSIIQNLLNNICILLLCIVYCELMYIVLDLAIFSAKYDIFDQERQIYTRYIVTP